MIATRGHQTTVWSNLEKREIAKLDLKSFYKGANLFEEEKKKKEERAKQLPVNTITIYKRLINSSKSKSLSSPPKKK